MKLLKKLFYSICVLIMLGCLGILVCALNPPLSEKLAGMLPVSMTKGNSLQNQGDSGTDDPTGGEDGQEGANTEGLVSNPGGDGEQYVVPAQGSFSLPEQVGDKSGYSPVMDSGQQMGEDEASRLQQELATGNVGDNFSFDPLIYPYYSMLNSDMQKLYRQVYANAVEGTESFAPVVKVNVNQVKNVFEAVYNDHPELFWLETEYACDYIGSGQCVELTLKYNRTAQNPAAEKEAFDAAANRILEGARAFDNIYEQEGYVHDALVAGVEYEPGAEMNQSAYSALVNGKSVCAGYARAFQYLMQQLGIPCYYCTGTSGEDHAWNIIKLADRYYNIDITWDDTVPATYDYFNKSDEEFSSTHIRNRLSVYLPACNSQGSGASESGGQVLINPDPQQPLNWEEYVKPGEEQSALDKLGLKEDDVSHDMKEYYADCLERMVKAGTGLKQFETVVPAALCENIERAYSDGSYWEGYVTKALSELKVENFTMQLQMVKLEGGYYRLYHNISTW